MAQIISTRIEIAATPDTVWNVLTDFNHYKYWNPFVKSIEGDFKEGKTITVCLEPPKGKPMVFNPTITKIEPTRQFVWLGKIFFPGLFDAEHHFEIKALDNNQVVFYHSEKFSGLLAKLILKLVGQSTEAGFQAMNLALKQRSEGDRK